MSNEKAREFLENYSISDFDVFGRHEEHYSLDDILAEYAKEQTALLQSRIKELEDELNLYKGSLKIPFKNYGDDGTSLSSDEITNLL